MSEAQAVAEKLGVVFKISLEKRIAGAEAVGAHKTSMLQDIEAGRFPEISALVGSVVELGKIVQVATPHIDAVYAITCLLARTLKDSNTFLLPKGLGILWKMERLEMSTPENLHDLIDVSAFEDIIDDPSRSLRTATRFRNLEWQELG